METQPRLQVSASSEVRGTDDHGGGHYDAPRGSRRHKGIDLVCVGGTLILAASDGIVTRCNGIVYADPEKSSWRYVQVTDGDGVQCRYMYVKQWTIQKGQQIKRGDVIGAAQGIETLYARITPHIHFETRLDSKTYLNPMDYLKGLE